MFKLASVWNEMSLSRKAILVGVLVATLIVFSAVMNMATKPRMAFLYGGLDASASGDVLNALETMDVDPEVRGDAIYVPEHRRDALRMALARQGLPQQGQPGFELLDELNGFATTSEMFDAAYWRAKEGELARTLLATPGVKSARVHIAVPKSSSFARRRRPPTASATITMSRGRLDMQQAMAMRYLIALAIPDMEAEQVGIFDSINGVILKPGAGDPIIDAEGDSLDRETRLEANLMNLLEARVGPGNARVTVSLDIDRERETVSERILDPESRVMMGRETTDMQQSESGSGSNAVTVASNLPEGDAAAGTQSNSSRSETNETTRFDISEVNRQREKMPGAIARVHVAALINDVPGADGAEPTPRTDAELQSIRDLVTAAVGFDEARGDIVTVKSMPFHEYEPVETPEESGGIMLWLQQNIMSVLQILIPAIVVIILGMFVLKPVLTQDISGATAIAEVGMPEDIGVEAGMISRTPLEELRDLSTSDKEKTATLLKEWLGETERAAQMGESALKDNECGGLAKAVRIPSLPGRQPGAPQVDTDCDAYKAGYAAATSALQASATEQEARHESFVASIGEMYAEMEMRYRQETLSLVERLFGAVAPALAVKSSLADIKAIVEERAQRNHSELSLRVHPSLIAHLGEADQRILNETPLVTLKSDESCAPATVDAQWKKGGLYHDPDALIENVLAALRDEAGSAEGDES